MSAIGPTAGDDGRDAGSRRVLSNKGGLLRVAGPVVAVGIAIAALIGSQKAPEYKLSSTSLTITAASGETIPFADITAMQLKDTMPPDLVKIVGDRVGTQLRGEFESNGTDMKIYVDTATPPFVYLTTTNGPVILNEQSATKTRSLYNEIEQKR